MSIDIPPAIRWLADILAGSDFPDTDEDKVNDYAAEVEASGEAAAQAVSGYTSHINAVADNVGGDVGASFRSYATNLAQFADSSADAADSMVGQLRDFAHSTADTKYFDLEMMIFTLWEIEALLYDPFTAEFVPGVIAAAQTSIVDALAELVDRTVAEGAVAAARMAAQQMAIDLLNQFIEMAKGWTHGLNIGELLLAGAMGAAGGVAHTAILHNVGKVAPDFVKTRVGQATIGAAVGAGLPVAFMPVNGLHGPDDGLAGVNGGLNGLLGKHGEEPHPEPEAKEPEPVKAPPDIRGPNKVDLNLPDTTLPDVTPLPRPSDAIDPEPPPPDDPPPDDPASLPADAAEQAAPPPNDAVAPPESDTEVAAPDIAAPDIAAAARQEPAATAAPTLPEPAPQPAAAAAVASPPVAAEAVAHQESAADEPVASQAAVPQEAVAVGSSAVAVGHAAPEALPPVQLPIRSVRPPGDVPVVFEAPRPEASPQEQVWHAARTTLVTNFTSRFAHQERLAGAVTDTHAVFTAEADRFRTDSGRPLDASTLDNLRGGFERSVRQTFADTFPHPDTPADPARLQTAETTFANRVQTHVDDLRRSLEFQTRQQNFVADVHRQVDTRLDGPATDQPVRDQLWQRQEQQARDGFTQAWGDLRSRPLSDADRLVAQQQLVEHARTIVDAAPTQLLAAHGAEAAKQTAGDVFDTAAADLRRAGPTMSDATITKLRDTFTESAATQQRTSTAVADWLRREAGNDSDTGAQLLRARVDEVAGPAGLSEGGRSAVTEQLVAHAAAEHVTAFGDKPADRLDWTPDQWSAAGDRWNRGLAALDDRTPALVARQTRVEELTTVAGQRFDRVAATVPELSPAGAGRAREQFLNDVTEADMSAVDDRSVGDRVAALARDLPTRLRYEASLETTLGEAGDAFGALDGGRWELSEHDVAALGEDFRADWAHEFDSVHGAGHVDVTDWLAHEKTSGDAFTAHHRQAVGHGAPDLASGVESGERPTGWRAARTELLADYADRFATESALRDAVTSAKDDFATALRQWQTGHPGVDLPIHQVDEAEREFVDDTRAAFDQHVAKSEQPDPLRRALDFADAAARLADGAQARLDHHARIAEITDPATRHVEQALADAELPAADAKRLADDVTARIAAARDDTVEAARRLAGSADDQAWQEFGRRVDAETAGVAGRIAAAADAVTVRRAAEEQWAGLVAEHDVTGLDEAELASLKDSFVDQVGRLRDATVGWRSRTGADLTPGETDFAHRNEELVSATAAELDLRADAEQAGRQATESFDRTASEHLPNLPPHAADPAVYRQVRDSFAQDARRAYRVLRAETGDRESARRQWGDRADQLLTTVAPKLEYQARLHDTIAELHDAIGSAAGSRVSQDGLTRITDTLRGEVTTAHRQTWQALADGRPMSTVERSAADRRWATLRRDWANSLDHRLHDDALLERTLPEAADAFGVVSDGHDVLPESFTKLAGDFRTDWVTARHATDGQHDLDVTDWLTAERAQRNAFGAAVAWRAVLDHVEGLSGVADGSWASRFRHDTMPARQTAQRLALTLPDGRRVTVLAAVDEGTGHTVLAARTVTDDGRETHHIEPVPGFDGRALLDLARGATLNDEAAMGVANRLGRVLRPPPEESVAHNDDPAPTRPESPAAVAVVQRRTPTPEPAEPVPSRSGDRVPVRSDVATPVRRAEPVPDRHAEPAVAVQVERTERTDVAEHAEAVQVQPPDNADTRPPTELDDVALPPPMRFRFAQRGRALSASDSATLADAAPHIAATAAMVHARTDGRFRLGVEVVGSGNGSLDRIDTALATGYRRAQNVAQNLAAEIDHHLATLQGSVGNRLTHEDIAWRIHANVDRSAQPPDRRVTRVDFSLVDASTRPERHVILFGERNVQVHGPQITALRALGRQAARYAVELPDGQELVVTVTGHGNGVRLATPTTSAELAARTGQRRAESVIDEFETGLVDELARMPANDGKVAPGDVVIVRRPGGRIAGVSALGRRTANLTFTTRPKISRAPTPSRDVARRESRPEPDLADLIGEPPDRNQLTRLPLDLMTRIGIPTTPQPPPMPTDLNQHVFGDRATPEPVPLDLAARLAPTTGHGSTSDGTERRAPWYLAYGAMGEFSLRSVPTWTDAQATAWTDRVIAQFQHPDRDALVARLRRELNSTFTADQDGWAKFLQTGTMFVEAGHLVWLRPAFADTHVPPPSTAADVDPDAGEGTVREFATRFSSTAAGVTREKSDTFGADTLLFTAFAAGSAALTHAVGAPQFSGQVTRVVQSGRHQTVISGRKMFVAGLAPFTSAVRVRILVDGDELRPAAPVVVPRGLGVEFPEQFTAPTEPRPPAATTPAGPVQVGSKVTRFPDVLNALDLTPVLGRMQHTLLDAKLTPTAVKAISEELQSELATESSVRSRSRWLTTTGDHSNMLKVRSSFLRSFRGHATFTADVDALRFLGVTPGVQVRDDLGVGTTSSGMRGGTSAAGIGVGYNAVGAVSGSTSDIGDSGDIGPHKLVRFTPLVGATLRLARTDELSVSGEDLTHTVLNEKGVQARYHAKVTLGIDFDSPSHRDLPPIREVVDGEIGVPWRDGNGPRDLEQALLGSVHSPELLAGPDGRVPLPAAGPLAAHPLVRALMRDNAVVRTLQRSRPTAMTADIGRPDPREPLALAARRGLGMSTAVSLPGAALVHDQISWVLRHSVSDSRRPKVDWSSVDRELDVHVGQPAMENDLGRLLAGVKHTVLVDGRPVPLAVRAFLRQRVGGSSYDLTVNNRALAANSVGGSRERGVAIVLAGGGGLRLNFGIVRLQLGGARLEGQGGFRWREQFGSDIKGYRRMETEGTVDQHDYLVVYQVRVGDVRWWVAGDQTLAQIVLAHQHVTAAPLVHDHAALVGAADHPTSWPNRMPGDFNFETGGTSGIYPAFFVMHELSQLTARMYATLRSMDDGFADDWSAWPDDLLDLSRPSSLAAHFPELAGRHGWSVDLPPSTRWNYTAVVRMRVFGSEHLDQPDDVEIEHYLQSNPHHANETEFSLKGGLNGATGLQFRDTQFDRLSLVAHASAGYTTSWSNSAEHGNVEITRVTYRTSDAFRGTPVFEVTVVRSNNLERQSATEFVRVPDGVELRVPPRRLEDVRTTVGTPAPDPPDFAANPQVSKGHLFGTLLPGTFHVERLRADAVLDEITSRLTDDLHVLRPGGAGQYGVNSELVLRSLQKSFSSDALETEPVDLFGSGVWRWLPVNRAFGRTEYLWVRVRADQVFPAHRHADRPGTKLTLRGEGLTKAAKGRSSGTESSFGGAGRARFGLGQPDGTGSKARDPRDAGFEVAGGFLWASGSSKEDGEKALEIFRANTLDDADEFEHLVRFRVEIGWSTELPTLLQAPFEVVKGGFWAAGSMVGHGPAIERFWHDNVTKVSSRFDDGSKHGRTVQGSVRALVPTHLTVPAGTTVDRPIVLRNEGANPTLVPFRDLTPQRPPDSLTSALHPWSIPAAAAMNRWARLMATNPKGPIDFDHPERSAPAIDFRNTAGLRFDHYTGNGMLRPQISALLNFAHRLPVGSHDVVVGLRINSAHPVGPAAIPFKARRYAQNDEEPKVENSHESGWHLGAGPEGGGDHGKDFVFERAPINLREHVDGERHESALGDTEEVNKEIRGTYRYFVFDVTMIAHAADNPHQMLEVDVPNGLIGMLRVDKQGNLLGDLPTTMPHLFGDLSRTRTPDPPPLPTIDEEPEPQAHEIPLPPSDDEASLSSVSAHDVPLPPSDDEASLSSVLTHDVPLPPSDDEASLSSPESEFSLPAHDVPLPPSEHGSTEDLAIGRRRFADPAIGDRGSSLRSEPTRSLRRDPPPRPERETPAPAPAPVVARVTRIEDPLARDLLAQVGNNWSAAKQRFLNDPKNVTQMQQLVDFRASHVDALIADVLRDHPMVSRSSVGSTNLHSDYDITVSGPGDVDVVAEFNQRFQDLWGAHSSTVFDTNVYVHAFLPEAGGGREWDQRPVAPTLAAGKAAVVRNHDVAALSHVRSELDPDAWRDFTASLAADDDARGRAEAADALNLQTVRDLLATLSPRDYLLSRTPEEQRAALEQIKARSPDLVARKMTDLYVNRVRKVRDMEAKFRSRRHSSALTVHDATELDRLAVAASQNLNRALTQAIEAYRSEGALLDVVGVQQSGDETIAPNAEHFLQSFNEQLGGILAELRQHYFDPGAAVVESAKYFHRMISAAGNIAQWRSGVNERRPSVAFVPMDGPEGAALRSLAGRADELLRLRAGQGEFAELTTAQRHDKALQILTETMHVDTRTVDGIRRLAITYGLRVNAMARIPEPAAAQQQLVIEGGESRTTTAADVVDRIARQAIQGRATGHRISVRVTGATATDNATDLAAALVTRLAELQPDAPDPLTVNDIGVVTRTDPAATTTTIEIS